MAFGDLSYLQQEVARLVEGIEDAPDSDSEDWAVRTSLINRAVHRWENVDATEWDELWTTYRTDGGTDTVTAGDSTYNCRSNFRRPGGWVKFTKSGNDYYFPVVTLNEVQVYQEQGANFCYFTGNKKTGYVLNVSPTPASGSEIEGATVEYPYYKYATELSGASDVTEMPDPDMIVYSVQAELLNAQKDREGYLNALSTSEEALKGMQIEQQLRPAWQDNSIPDLQERQGVGFGE